jgi:hypothetical protein
MRRLSLFDQKVDRDMLNEMGKGCADKFVAKASKPPVLTDVLSQRGVQGKHQRRKMLINAQTGGCNTNDNTH